MEPPRRADNLSNSELSVVSGSLSAEPGTFSSTDLGSSRPESAVVTPFSSWPSIQPSSTQLNSLEGLPGSPSSFGDVTSTFLTNKGAMGGVFAGLGILVISIIGIIYFGWIRKRHASKRRRQSRNMSQAHRSETFSDIIRRLDGNTAYRSESPNVFSINSNLPSRRRSMSSVAEWLARRKRERRASQFRNIYYGSGATSIVEDDIKNVGQEETQWTLGKVLEDQQQQAITPLPHLPRPPPLKRPQSIHSTTRAPVRERRSVGEGEGGNFTLEDALLPSLSSSPISYELGSTRTGRHPYAQM